VGFRNGGWFSIAGEVAPVDIGTGEKKEGRNIDYYFLLYIFICGTWI